MDQPPLTDMTDESEDDSKPLPYLSLGSPGGGVEGAFVAIARNPSEFGAGLRDATPDMQWLQVESLLGDAAVWSAAARDQSEVALDVVMTDPATEYPLIYRLVDVSKVRDVRITIPVRKGFFKALRLAAALHFPVRLLPSQPSEEELAEMIEAIGFYLHDPMVEVPVEFFHSTLAWCHGASTVDLWTALEQDPAVFQYLDENHTPILPADRPGTTADVFVDEHLRQLVRDQAECATCRYRDFCRGFFKLPDPDYSCEGIVAVLDRLHDAAQQIGTELSEQPLSPVEGNSTPI